MNIFYKLFADDPFIRAVVTTVITLIVFGFITLPETKPQIQKVSMTWIKHDTTGLNSTISYEYPSYVIINYTNGDSSRIGQ